MVTTDDPFGIEPIRPDPVALARSGATLAEIATATGLSVSDVTDQLIAAQVQPDTPAHKLRAQDALLQRGLGMTVASEVMTRDGPVSLAKQLPPDPAALASYLQATMPERYKHDQPVTAVQFVVALPAPSRDGQTWLSDIGRDADGHALPMPAITKP